MIVRVTAEETRNDEWVQRTAYLFTNHTNSKRAFNWAIKKAQRKWPGFKRYTVNLVKAA